MSVHVLARERLAGRALFPGHKREGERDELKGRVKGVVKDVRRTVKGAVKY
jgi:hypothetical protein